MGCEAKGRKSASVNLDARSEYIYIDRYRYRSLNKYRLTMLMITEIATIQLDGTNYR